VVHSLPWSWTFGARLIGHSGLGKCAPLVPRTDDGRAGRAFDLPQTILRRSSSGYVGEPVAFIVGETLDRPRDLVASDGVLEYEICRQVYEAEQGVASVRARGVVGLEPGQEEFFNKPWDKPSRFRTRLSRGDAHCGRKTG